jgi:pentatricopeptide repeat protein
VREKELKRAFQIYKSMLRSGCHPNEHTFKMLVSTFCKNEDFDGAVQVLKEMFERSMAPDSGSLSEICSWALPVWKNSRGKDFM